MNPVKLFLVFSRYAQIQKILNKSEAFLARYLDVVLTMNVAMTKNLLSYLHELHEIHHHLHLVHIHPSHG